MNKLLKIHPEDNVAVALVNLRAGDKINLGSETLVLQSPVKAKHKVSLKILKAGDPVYMYGVLVGSMVESIHPGEVLTPQNLKHLTAPTTRKTSTTSWTPPDITPFKDRHFLGFHRSDHQVGTANIWLFFPLVFCENRIINTLREVFEKELGAEEISEQRQLLRSLVQGKSKPAPEQSISKQFFENVQVRFITHQGGCGGTREDSVTLARLLAGYVKNPNVAGASVLSLGCQNLQIQVFKDALDALNLPDDKPVYIYEQQQIGTVEEMMNKIIIETFDELKQINQQQRRPAPLSKLVVGLECGGSDGFSGISANPVLGWVSDMLSALGGTPVLSEFPELCGVEQELVNRCTTEENATKFLNLMKAYEKAAEAVGSGFDMNPSPGNIKDGLITDAMKSAGAAKKGGTSPITDVLDYGEYVSKPGLNLLCTPGNDVESTTAMVGAGANLVVFTTGLGTPTGNPISPVIKVSSNSELAQKMPDIIDVDCGPVIQGEKSIEEMGTELLNYMIEVASGRIKAKAEQLGQQDFIPWKRGVSL